MIIAAILANSRWWFRYRPCSAAAQIHVGETKVLDHLDAYTAPRLVEYHDPDPCELERRMRRSLDSVTESVVLPSSAQPGRASGVTVEARYSVGEYDVGRESRLCTGSWRSCTSRSKAAGRSASSGPTDSGVGSWTTSFSRSRRAVTSRVDS